ncbi:MAG: T9SS type A sorting domain-containing protein [Ignavibacteria bacterium]|nr:T9SS type A sorting domain-containing protein [Ignavibacteria bacterium]
MKYQALILSAYLVQPFTSFSQNARIPWSAFDMGYELSATTNVRVKSAIGQSFVERTGSGNTWIFSGFLADTLLRETLTSVGISDELPKDFALGQNYPNPFNPVTTIRFAVPTQSHVTIVTYNILGQIVRRLVDDEMAPGIHSVRFEASDLSSGVYFYTMRAGAFSQTRKLMVLR